MKKLFGTSEFSKNVLTLVSGTGLAQIITLAASPVLTRLFLPEEFASFALFTSLVGILSVVAAGRFEFAILLPKENAEAKTILLLSVLISIFTGLITLFGLVIYDFWIVNYIPSKNFNNWFYLLPITVSIIGMYSSFNYWSTRNKTFIKNTYGRVTSSAIAAGSGIGFGYANFTPGLILSFVLGQLFALLLLASDWLKSGAKFFAGIRSADLKKSFKTHKDFAFISTPHALVDSTKENGVVFFLTFYFTETLVGLYSFAIRTMKAPLGMIGSAVYQVFYQKVSQSFLPDEEVKKMVKSVYLKMFLIGIVPFTLLFFFGPSIFAFVFGEPWREAGVIAQILSPWLLLNFMVSPVSCIPLIYQKQRHAFLLTCIEIVLRFSALIVGGILQNYYLTMMIISGIGVLLMIYAIYWYLKIIKLNDRVMV